MPSPGLRQIYIFFFSLFFLFSSSSSVGLLTVGWLIRNRLEVVSRKTSNKRKNVGCRGGERGSPLDRRGRRKKEEEEEEDDD